MVKVIDKNGNCSVAVIDEMVREIQVDAQDAVKTIETMSNVIKQ